MIGFVLAIVSDSKNWTYQQSSVCYLTWMSFVKWRIKKILCRVILETELV